MSYFRFQRPIVIAVLASSVFTSQKAFPIPSFDEGRWIARSEPYIGTETKLYQSILVSQLYQNILEQIINNPESPGKVVQRAKIILSINKGEDTVSLLEVYPETVTEWYNRWLDAKPSLTQAEDNYNYLKYNSNSWVRYNQQLADKQLLQIVTQVLTEPGEVALMKYTGIQAAQIIAIACSEDVLKVKAS